MGVEARVVLWAPSEAVAREAAAAAFARVDALEASWSHWRADSELSRLLARGPGAAVPVSEDLFRILARSLELARASDGAFDVTIGPAVEVVRARGRIEGAAARGELRDALERVDWRAVELDPAARTARLTRPDMAIDLGGIGKGAACTAALEVLEGRGLPRALVELGGDLAVGEPPPGKTGWTVRADPRELELAHRAVASSGWYVEVVSDTGEPASAVLDPSTAAGLRLVTARRVWTAVARDGATADGLATIANVVAEERARRIFADVDPTARLYVHPPADPAPADPASPDPAPEETDR